MLIIWENLDSYIISWQYITELGKLFLSVSPKQFWALAQNKSRAVFYLNRSNIDIYNSNLNSNPKKSTSSKKRQKLILMIIQYSYNQFLYNFEISISIKKGNLIYLT